ncbi:hypothetical protein GGR50DRAFT_690484 [Xylaria sp. CBS 124048]|nr:hypothetical protein GGR50DRAFT_690484 [Xylaria sp. CBS 124048]
MPGQSCLQLGAHLVLSAPNANTENFNEPTVSSSVRTWEMDPSTTSDAAPSEPPETNEASTSTVVVTASLSSTMNSTPITPLLATSEVAPPVQALPPPRTYPYPTAIATVSSNTPSSTEAMTYTYI